MNMSLDDLASSPAFGGGNARREQVSWLPEPEPRERIYTVISVDDHVVEPPDAFTGRFPKRFAGEEPRVVDTDDGGEAWVWQGQQLPNVGFNAVVGRPSSEYGFEPTRFDEMRRGAWDVNARVADMDIDGVWASLCFPSFLPGFVGQRLTMWPDSDELALAAMRAYNDWHLEAWCGAHPERFVPNQIAYLRDPEIAAREIRRNAERGFKAVTFSEAPDKLGLPTIHSGYWDPLFAACAETGTVLCLHVGSSGTSPTTSADAPPEIPAVLFGAYGMYSAVDWLYSKVPVRFPDIRICLSEGGIGWVAGILDRLDHCYRYQLGYLPTWRDVDLSPSEVLRRNFWFCALDDDAGMLVRDRIGVDHILVESDYPHADSSWPDTQAMLVRQLRDQGVPEHDARRITWENASELFRHPVPGPMPR
jgi:predicted TIM-barrel fold metal-dependent hydrolase